MKEVLVFPFSLWLIFPPIHDFRPHSMLEAFYDLRSFMVQQLMLEDEDTACLGINIHSPLLIER